MAIKVLGPASDLDDAARARFGREAVALGQLAHPHLVALLDHGVDDELGPYLVLPLLPGPNLRALCAGHALGPEAAVLLLQPIVEAAAALHAAGFVHRDLKPENAIAGPDGAITVIDLGLAWREGMTRHTDTGVAVGSIGYMAPEQLEGRAVDARVDVWALGVMLYEWVCGKRPFLRERAAEEAAAVLVGAYSRLAAADRRCDDALADLAARCLSTDPARRPSAAELAAALAARVDWTDAPATERAAVVADPLGYQRRVAPHRARRIERTARAALAAGDAFGALAHCDRGLAYAPNDTALLALVAEAERGAPEQAEAAAVGDTAPAMPIAPDGSAAAPTAAATPTAATPAAATPVAATTSVETATPVVAATSVETATPRARRGPWLVVGVLALALAAGAVIVYLAIPERETAPVSAARVDVKTPRLDERDRELLSGMVSLIDKAVTNAGGPTAPAGPTPTTAAGWLRLAATQPPAEAVASIRRALALSPSWVDAQVALCAALAGAHDAGAIAACDVALARRPGDPSLHAARGAALLRAGEAARALVDLDLAVRGDPDPKWRRLRARAREATGDHDGAARDLAHACQLGDAAACTPN